MNEEKKNFEINDNELNAASGGANGCLVSKTCSECGGTMYANFGTKDGLPTLVGYICSNCLHTE